MIKLKNVSGFIEIDDKITRNSQQAYNNMVLKDDKRFHYAFKAHNNSEANILIEGPDVSRTIKLKAGQSASITNDKSRFRPQPGLVKTVSGNVWAWLEDKFGNPTAWLEPWGGGGGIRG